MLPQLPVTIQPSDMPTAIFNVTGPSRGWKAVDANGQDIAHVFLNRSKCPCCEKMASLVVPLILPPFAFQAATAERLLSLAIEGAQEGDKVRVAAPEGIYACEETQEWLRSKDYVADGQLMLTESGDWRAILFRHKDAP